MDNGAQVDAVNFNGVPPLLHAMGSRQYPIIRLLLERGASTETPYLNDPDESECSDSPLAYAFECEDSEMAALLYEFGARVYGADKKRDEFLWSPFSNAIAHHLEEDVLKGLQHGVHVTQYNLDFALEFAGMSIKPGSHKCEATLKGLKIVIHLLLHLLGRGTKTSGFDNLFEKILQCLQTLIAQRKIRSNTHDYNWLHRSIIRLVTAYKPEFLSNTMQWLTALKTLAKTIENTSLDNNNNSTLIPNNAAETVTALDNSESGQAAASALDAYSVAATAKRTGSPMHSSGKFSRAENTASAADKKASTISDSMPLASR